MLTIAIIAAAIFLPLVLADCSISPIYLDIHQRHVEGTSELSYGASMNVGTPAQTLSLWPSLELNETTVANDGFCTSSPCSASSAHGLFDPSKSSSFRSTPVTQLDNSAVLTGSISNVAESGTDVLHLLQQFSPNDTPTQTNISSFPLQLLSNYTSSQNPFFGPAGLVGLGPSSTLLKSLHKAGNISSRSYGLYLGDAYRKSDSSTGSNGSLTLGGYDAARFQEPIQSFQITEAENAISPLQLHVSGMTLSNGSRTMVDLLNGNDFDAYISTTQYELTLPPSLANIVVSLKATSDKDSIFVGSNFTIILGDSFTVSFNPAWIATNPVNFSTSTTGPYIFGTAFLSNTYLAVSYDSTPPQFYLAPANQETPFIAPEPLCPNSVPTPGKPANLSFFIKNGLIGLIIGATIGGSALIILAFVLVRSLRRRREKKQVLQLVNLKRQEVEEEEVELGDVKGNVMKMKAQQVHVVERMEHDRRATGEWDAEAQMEAPIYFDPPPRRATVMRDDRNKTERKRGLKGILKVKVAEHGPHA